MPTQQEFNRYFLKLLCSNTYISFVDNNGNPTIMMTEHVGVFTEDDKWLFSFRLDQLRPLFVYSYIYISDDIKNHFEITTSELRSLLRNLVINLFNMPETVDIF